MLRHTPGDVAILICDDASPDHRSSEHVRELEGRDAERRLFYLRQPHNVGFPANVNAAFAAAAPADVVILNSDCVVAGGWLDGLHAAAYCDSRVATATALSNHGTIVSVPERGVPSPHLPEGWSLDAATAAVRKHSLRLRPRVPTGVGHCMYVRRSALELVGEFDTAFTPGYGEEVDFSQRCLRSGLTHVVADDVLVYHHGARQLCPGREPSARIQAEHERVLARAVPVLPRDDPRAGADRYRPVGTVTGRRAPRSDGAERRDRRTNPGRPHDGYPAARTRGDCRGRSNG